MGCKYPSYIREWRKKADLTQKQVVSRLAEKAGHQPAEDPALRIPTTEASLSRIENGEQNFNAATLVALAEVLGADEYGWLLTRNPLKAGEVVSLQSYVEQLDAEQAARAAAVLEAMFGTHG